MDSFFWQHSIITHILRDQYLKKSADNKFVPLEIEVNWLSGQPLRFECVDYQLLPEEKSLFLKFNPIEYSQYKNCENETEVGYVYNLGFQNHVDSEELRYLKLLFRPECINIEIQVFNPVRIFQNAFYTAWIKRYLDDYISNGYTKDISPRTVLQKIILDQEAQFVTRVEGFMSRYLVNNFQHENLSSNYFDGDGDVEKMDYDSAFELIEYQNKCLTINLDFRSYGKFLT